MSIITIATSKGGAGKTTTAQLITGSIAARGHRVAAIDADYNHSLASWVTQFGEYPIDVHQVIDETKIIPKAEELEANHDLVVIDTAGAATQATVFAIGCADLVLIPCQLSSADVIEAVKTKQLVDSAASMTRRDIPVRVVLTDYQPNTVIAGHVHSEITSAGLLPLTTTLNRLVAYKEMTFNGQVPDTGSAGQQVQQFITELADLEAMPFLKLPMAS